MWILIAPESGGVYAAKDLTNTKVVQIFEEEDDAVRYHGLLLAEDFKDIAIEKLNDFLTVDQDESFGISMMYEMDPAMMDIVVK